MVFYQEKILDKTLSGRIGRKNLPLYVFRGEKMPVKPLFGFHGKKKVSMRLTGGEAHVVQRHRVHRHAHPEPAHGATRR
jgi:hypothetical protein